MRALMVNEYGDPSKLTVSEIDEKDPRASEVKIRVEGVGIGYFDGLLVKGEYQLKPPVPFTPGSSLAGTVEAVGEKISHVKPGDRVAAFALLGGLAEKAIMPGHAVFPIPQTISANQASNFFIAYATGVYGLKTLGDLKEGETLLVLGASGTTGSTAIEIAKAIGATVIACASSEEKREYCKSLGADITIDYTAADWRKAVKAVAPKGVDVIYDPVGGDLAEPALRSLAPGGRYLVVGFVTGIASIPLNLTLLKQCSIIGVNWGGATMTNPAVVPPVIKQIVEWTEAGKLKPAPDHVYPLAEAGKAFSEIFERRSRGTIVIDPSI